MITLHIIFTEREQVRQNNLYLMDRLAAFPEHSALNHSLNLHHADTPGAALRFGFSCFTSLPLLMSQDRRPDH